MKSRLTIFLLLFAWRAFADANADFDTANKFYQQGNFAKAAGIYEQLVQSGITSHALYFNLGNARLKSGSEGRAIAAFREAERLAPREADLHANLQLARNQISDNATLRPTSLQRAFGQLTMNEWTKLAGIAVAALFVLLALREWRAEFRRSLGGLTKLAALASMILIVGAMAAWALDYSEPTAVVITKEAAVRAGPLDDATTLFNAKDGVEFAVADTRDSWLQVRDGQRRIGWVKRDAVQLVKP